MSRKRGRRTQRRKLPIPAKLVSLLAPYVPAFERQLERERVITVHVAGKAFNVDRWFLDYDRDQPDPIFDENKETPHGKSEDSKGSKDINAIGS